MTSKSEAFVATITRVGRGRETAWNSSVFQSTPKCPRQIGMFAVARKRTADCRRAIAHNLLEALTQLTF